MRSKAVGVACRGGRVSNRRRVDKLTCPLFIAGPFDWLFMAVDFGFVWRSVDFLDFRDWENFIRGWCAIEWYLNFLV